MAHSKDSRIAKKGRARVQDANRDTHEGSYVVINLKYNGLSNKRPVFGFFQ
jgi:hypothetical protein